MRESIYTNARNIYCFEEEGREILSGREHASEAPKLSTLFFQSALGCLFCFGFGFLWGVCVCVCGGGGGGESLDACMMNACNHSLFACQG